ncbi:MAG: LysM peptidoglycan-binding domain-containing protein [Mariniblastus sp.]
MGSVQQVVLGIICLVAAFAFGNYVNNNPPLHNVAETDASVSADQVAQSGNIQSRLPSGSLDLVEQRASNIATVRQPLKSRFSLPDRTVAANTDPFATENKLSLPPPNQLANGQTIPRQPTSQTNLVSPTDVGFAPVLDSGMASNKPMNSGKNQINIPDFSAIAAQFNNTPLPQGQLGSMPQHQPPKQFGSGMQVQQKPKPIENLYDQFQTEQPTVAGNSDPVNVWDTRQASSFSSEDFAPKLKDHLAMSGTTFNSVPPAPIENSGQSNVPPRNNSVIDSVLVDSAPANPTMQPINRNSTGSSQPTMRGYRGQLETSNLADTGWENRNQQRENSSARNPIQSTATNANLGRRFGSINRNSTSATNETPFAIAPLDAGSNQTASNYQSNRVAAHPNQVRSKLPFGLTNQAKTQMAELRSRASSNIALETTRFVDHTVQRGETLQSISTRYFGKPDFYLDVYLANRNQLRNPAIVPAGMVLKVPVYE